MGCCSLPFSIWRANRTMSLMDLPIVFFFKVNAIKRFHLPICETERYHLYQIVGKVVIIMMMIPMKIMMIMILLSYDDTRNITEFRDDDDISDNNDNNMTANNCSIAPEKRIFQ